MKSFESAFFIKMSRKRSIPSKSFNAVRKLAQWDSSSKMAEMNLFSLFVMGKYDSFLKQFAFRRLLEQIKFVHRALTVLKFSS